MLIFNVRGAVAAALFLGGLQVGTAAAQSTSTVYNGLITPTLDYGSGNRNGGFAITSYSDGLSELRSGTVIENCLS